MTLEIKDLKKSYKDVAALRSLSFSLSPGRILALLGPNGAGKSTAIKIMTTLVPPDGGQILWEGRDILREPRKIRDLVGYVSQELAMDKVLTAVEFMQFTAGILHLKWRDHRDRALQLLDRLGLKEAQDRQIGKYSGGMKRRLDLATALLHNPRILILDEPTTGLDIEARELIWSLIRDFTKEGGSVILASHDFQEVQQLADEVLILDRGVVSQSGTPQALKEQLGQFVVRLQTREYMTARDQEQAAAVFAGQTGLRVLNHDDTWVALAVQGESAMSEVQGTILSHLEGADLPVFSLNVQHPNMEDVYRFSLRGDS
ncbi:ABC transporter ATP-binding protein [Sulfidibacter corallicola]|uniref:ABC transporter ATP-binding protein n=1 Tax=Sulfidibacter corallicola TaxID=2818388 RepID=A0A8A4TFT7_SULCO|nr:ABC transporter ATP-binding protein [Sulfidibacter corallicola]QTD47568.1 ABC transporter ATP-binding protein [Sulfidibacter corallicola]